MVPRIPNSFTGSEADSTQRALLENLLAIEGVRRPVLYYFTHWRCDSPAISARRWWCMTAWTSFRICGRPAGYGRAGAALLARADLVFTGGVSLFEAKRHLHPNVHAFPSSVDVAHFARARALRSEPRDQAPLPRPRLGFYGVIDERSTSS